MGLLAGANWVPWFATSRLSALLRRRRALGGRYRIFLGSAATKLADFSATSEYVASTGLPAPGLFLAGAIALELLGGLSVLLGYRARLGALALAAFLVPATLLFHLEPGNPEQTIHAMKNLSILGGLLIVSAQGAGPLALDSRRIAR